MIISSDNKYIIVAGWDRMLAVINVENQTIKKLRQDLDLPNELGSGPARVALVEHPDYAQKFIVLYGRMFNARIYSFEDLEELYFIRKDRRTEHEKNRWWHDENLHTGRALVRHPDPR